MTVRGGKSIQRKLTKIKNNLRDNVADAAESSLDATERRAKRKVVENDAVASTDLYRGFRQTHTYVVKTRGPAERYTLTNSEPHAKLVEWGTGGHFGTGGSWGFSPPPNRYESPSFSIQLIIAIKDWIMEKPGFRKARPPRWAAVPIARSIARGSPSDPLPGTSAQPFMRPAWFVEKPKLKTKAVWEAKKTIRRA